MHRDESELGTRAPNDLDQRCSIARYKRQSYNGRRIRTRIMTFPMTFSDPRVQGHDITQRQISRKRCKIQSYIAFSATIWLYLQPFEIIGVKESRDLENWVRGCSRSSNMVLFDLLLVCHCTIALSCTIFELLDIE